MAISRVQIKSADSGAVSVNGLPLVFDSAPTVGNLIVGAAVCNTAQYTILWDTGAFTFVIYPKSTTNQVNVCLFFGRVITGSGTTVTIDPFTSSVIAGVVAEYSGVYPLRPDVIDATTGNGMNIAITANTATRTNNQLWVAAAGQRLTNFSNNFSSPAGGFSIVAQDGSTVNTSNSDRGIALLEKIVSSTGTPAPGVTSSTSNNWCIAVAALEEAPSSQSSGVFGQF